MQRITESYRLTPKQENAVLELINSPTCTKAEICVKLGISEKTIYNWLRLPQFQERLAEARENIRRDAFNSLKQALNESVEVLRQLLHSENETTKLKSALSIISFNLQVIETEEVQKRLSKLEEKDDDDEEGYRV